MVLLNQKNKLFDPIRSIWVEATAEEQIRQSLLAHMLDIGYPKSLIGIEIALHKLNSEAPFSQRADLLVYDTGGNVLALIECKAYKVDQKTLDQACSYNRYLNALWIACVGPGSLISVINTKEGFKFEKQFLSYEKLRSLEGC